MINATRGFTLLEAIVAIGIFALTVGSIIEIMNFSFRSRNIVWEQLATQNEGRKTIQDFTNQLRTATQSSIGGYPIAAASTSSITFYSNIDTDTWRERVRYFMSGTTLRRGVIKPSGNPLAYNSASEVITDIVHDITTSTPVFYYYGENFNGSTNTSSLSYPIDVTQIRVVGIRLYMEEDPHLSPAPLLVEGKVSIRNLKDN